MISAWYIPAWNGDFRLEPDPNEPETRTLLTIEKPTPEEKKLLKQLQQVFAEKFGLGYASDDSRKMREPSRFFKTRVSIPAPITDIGPVVASLCKPGPNVLTAVKFKNGHIEVCETSESGASSKRPQPYRSPSDPPGSKALAKPADDKPSEESKALAKKEDATAAATVKRPTPCCPACYTDEIELNKPATEVLLAFLNREEHESWAKNRFIVVRGGITGHRYLIAHRNSPVAQKNTRMAYDLDDRATMHFHDWLVPPQEEVLAAMFILKFREPWLRNEATAFSHRYVFKNPFGDGGDGVKDSIWTHSFGAALLDFLAISKNHRGPPRESQFDIYGNATLVTASPTTWTLPS